MSEQAFWAIVWVGAIVLMLGLAGIFSHQHLVSMQTYVAHGYCQRTVVGEEHTVWTWCGAETEGP